MYLYNRRPLAIFTIIFASFILLKRKTFDCFESVHNFLLSRLVTVIVSD